MKLERKFYSLSEEDRDDIAFGAGATAGGLGFSHLSHKRRLQEIDDLYNDNVSRKAEFIDEGNKSMRKDLNKKIRKNDEILRKKTLKARGAIFFRKLREKIARFKHVNIVRGDIKDYTDEVRKNKNSLRRFRRDMTALRDKALQKEAKTNKYVKAASIGIPVTLTAGNLVVNKIKRDRKSKSKKKDK